MPMIEQLSSRIWKHKEFHQEFHDLMKQSLRQGLSLDISSDSPVSEDAIKRLIECAAIFAATEVLEYQSTAFRIASGTWNCFREQYDNLAEPVELILSRLGNFPSVKLLREQASGSNPTHISSFALELETALHREENTVELLNQEVLLTDFQRRLWNSLSTRRSLALSAPTSAGKSFVLYNYLLDRLSSSDHFVGVYIVPTRALISQVSTDLKEGFLEYDLKGVRLSPIPVAFSEFNVPKLIYVLTQERLQSLLQNDSGVQFDIVVADEAQSVQDGHRGVVFQSVLENVIQRSLNTQIIFAAPLARNPEVFADIFAIPDLEPVKEDSSPVSQNIIVVERVPKRQKRFRLTLKLDQGPQVIGDLAVKRSFQGIPRTLANLAWELGQGDSNLVYYGAPSGCEKTAIYLGEIIEEENATEISKAVTNFAAFVEENIHPEFPLVETLRKGVAFHYGKIPNTVRQGVEGLFASGDIKYIVATSTLLQGVNMPAKNVFLYDPRKGSNSLPLTSIEFWNLAGRAGRLRKDFEGNIYLIDHSRWKEDPLQGEKNEEIASSTSAYLSKRTDEFIEFIQNTKHGTGVEQGLENVFVKLFIASKEGRLMEVLERSAPTLVAEHIARLIDLINDTSAVVTLPVEVIRQNKSVSPYRQQALYEYLDDFAKVRGIEELIPIHPLAEKSYDRLEAIYRILWEQLEMRNDRTYVYLTLMSYRWMAGQSYRMIIDQAIKHDREQRKSNKKNPSTVIREVLATINDDVRYKMVKLTRCYGTILDYTLRTNGYDVEQFSIPDLPLYLEIGASSTTMVSLISLGLSRITARIVAERISARDWDTGRVLEWLRQRSTSLNVPDVLQAEIRRIV